MPEVLLATRKGLLHFEVNSNAATLLRESHLGARVSYVQHDPRTDMLYACLDHGHWGVKLQRSDDHGITWKELDPPKYPEGSQIREGEPAVLKYLWCVTPAAESEPGKLFFGTEPGGLFVTEDNGEHIQLVQSLWDHPSREKQWMGGGRDEAGIHSILVNSQDPAHLLVGISVAGTFESTDAGQSWIPRNHGLTADFLPDPTVEVGHDPHLVVQCDSQVEKLWQQNHGGIFRSVDYGKNWQAVSSEDKSVHFGFAIEVDPEDGETAWVVPALSDEQRVAIERKLFVAKTEDGGITWQKFSEGLPQQNCYDFALRHNLVLHHQWMVLATAGGAFYLSTDRGETWTTVAEHLPPVYCVKIIE